MKLSVIIATKDRAHAIGPCLSAVAAAFAKAEPLDAEIVIVDNGSTDGTAQTIKTWIAANPMARGRYFHEATPGKSAALNRALREAHGALLAFTDDDCCPAPDWIKDMLRHDASDTCLVLRGGAIKLGDPTDLPYTISRHTKRESWSLVANSARHMNLADTIAGCNMVMRRSLVEALGLFDENFGPGSSIGSGEDTDYLFRAYLAGALIELVPDMTVFHHHGRKSPAEARKLFGRYMIGTGALNLKYLFTHPNFCRQTYWDAKLVFREIVTGTNLFLPEIGFSHLNKLTSIMRGAALYLWLQARQRALTS